ncbi:MAG TPA: DNA alkylation repair protein [Terriglobia bacterium]|nr:DNA alkylation repair protein [Terriglobia bacterium]
MQTSTQPERLLRKLRVELKRVAAPRKAPEMQRYMKSAMPYFGVPAPVLRRVLRTVFADLEFADFQSWKSTVLYVWRNARYREELYAAIGLAECRPADAFQIPPALAVYEEMIVSGAWWDVVDPIASHCVGKLLRRYPRRIGRTMRSWSRSKSIWKRRTSILCQLGFKKETDLQLMYECIEPSMNSKEFFLRKAIGWALRQYAWTDPVEVHRYVRKNSEKLSRLSAREALRNIR